jgi:hypothetical protein
MTDTTRSMRILDMAEAMGEDTFNMLDDIMYDVLDGAILTPLHRLIRDSFSGDDDFDDLRHEIAHDLGDCSDDDDKCPWRYGDDD